MSSGGLKIIFYKIKTEFKTLTAFFSFQFALRSQSRVSGFGFRVSLIIIADVKIVLKSKERVQHFSSSPRSEQHIIILMLLKYAIYH